MSILLSKQLGCFILQLLQASWLDAFAATNLMPSGRPATALANVMQNFGSSVCLFALQMTRTLFILSVCFSWAGFPIFGLENILAGLNDLCALP